MLIVFQGYPLKSEYFTITDHTQQKQRYLDLVSNLNQSSNKIKLSKNHFEKTTAIKKSQTKY